MKRLLCGLFISCLSMLWGVTLTPAMAENKISKAVAKNNQIITSKKITPSHIFGKKILLSLVSAVEVGSQVKMTAVEKQCFMKDENDTIKNMVKELLDKNLTKEQNISLNSLFNSPYGVASDLMLDGVMPVSDLVGIIEGNQEIEILIAKARDLKAIEEALSLLHDLNHLDDEYKQLMVQYSLNKLVECQISIE
ncbi:hypothetical protein [Moraxella oblonga]|uniref:hypothetical protein n=1 Tax=Moraxella oblonga TaxID=200413 RepID=UPI00082C63D3|nr:hypothetical protein [Moraxella oblonga]